eukprot:6074844-Pyramimonas_sp.AAC.1
MLSSRSVPSTTALFRKGPRDTSRARQPLVIRMATKEQFALVKGRKAVFRATKSGSIELVSQIYSNASQGCIDRVNGVWCFAVVAFQTEGTRSLRDYMSLPPSEYSVLDADKITRIDEKHFRSCSTLLCSIVQAAASISHATLLRFIVQAAASIAHASAEKIGCFFGRCELSSINFLGTMVSPVLTAEVNVKPNGEGTVIRVVDAEVLGSGLAEKANNSFMGEFKKSHNRTLKLEVVHSGQVSRKHTVGPIFNMHHAH